MASLADIGVPALINIHNAFAFLLAFALLRLQPINDRVYFPKWYISGGRSSPMHSANFVAKFVNLNFKTYLTFLNWMPPAMKMSETEIINHAGLDSAVFLRIYILGACRAIHSELKVWIAKQKKFKDFTCLRESSLLVPYLQVVVGNVPCVPGHSISDTVDHFFQTNHPNQYLGHQAVYNANKFAKLCEEKR